MANFTEFNPRDLAFVAMLIANNRQGCFNEFVRLFNFQRDGAIQHVAHQEAHVTGWICLAEFDDAFWHFWRWLVIGIRNKACAY